MYELLWRIAFAVFLAALVPSAVCVITQLALRKTGSGETPKWLIWLRRGTNVVIGVGLALLTASILARWGETGYPPFSNVPESLLWMAWGYCVVYLATRAFIDFPGMEVAGCLGVVAILALSAHYGHSVRPLMPALQSNWLIFHVFTCMVSYGAFFAAFLTAILWLSIWRKRESSRVVDALLYQMMAFGLFMLTIGIISGSVWARQAWGRYWGWDPKETWSLITWLVYAVYLHFRMIAGSFGLSQAERPKLNAVFAIIGFAVTMFTYFGVNYLLSGLHSYA